MNLQQVIGHYYDVHAPFLPALGEEQLIPLRCMALAAQAGNDNTML
jgi:hypothetical protein